MYRQAKISDYLNALASKAPVPGGGSVAALVGAVGCATLAKVVNFTLGKEKYKACEEEMADILKRLEIIREDFSRLCSEDAKAYSKVSSAFKLPEDEKREAILKEAALVPLEVCEKSREAMKLVLPVMERGNPNLITDTKIAELLFKCALKSAVLNVEINLKSIKDNDFIREVKEKMK